MPEKPKKPVPEEKNVEKPDASTWNEDKKNRKHNEDDTHVYKRVED